MFADDIIMTFESSNNTCINLQRILKTYSSFTNLQINQHKFELFFPKNGLAVVKHKITNLLT